MRRRRTPLLILLLTLAPAAWAETLYVIDTLRVNVRQEPGRNTPPLGVVVTGMSLEELDRREGYVKIRNDEGLEGWIKDDYLSTEKPAQLLREESADRLSELEEELDRVRDSLDTAQREKTSALEELERAQLELEARAEQASGEAPPAATPTAAPSRSLEDNRSGNGMGIEQPHFQLSTDTLPYWIGGILFIALLGFVSGISWYKNHVSRKLGGLRI